MLCTGTDLYLIVILTLLSNEVRKNIENLIDSENVLAKIDFEFPYIQNSKILENSGKLIFDSQTGSSVYKKTMQRLASVVCMGG